MKIVYSDPKTGKSAQIELEAEKGAVLLNMRVNEMVDGALVGLNGYKLKITGGSDKSGFPLNKNVQGAIKTRIFKSVASSGRSKGIYKRQSVRGGTVTQDTEQLNTIIVEYGEKPVTELFPEKSKEAKEAEKKEREEKEKEKK